MTSPPERTVSAGRRRLLLLLHLLLFTLAMGLFSWALEAADPAELGGNGLLDVLPPQFYVVLLLLVLGFVLAVTGPRPAVPLLVLYTLGLIALLHGTVPILFEEPRYPWTYKHIAATELIAATGRAHPTVDIYNNWPGFFALNAWFSDALRVEPLEYARWAQPFFAVVGFGAAVFALRGFSADSRTVFAAGWLFVVANWVGQEYFAPQASAFVLALVIVGLVSRGTPADADFRGPRLRRIVAPFDRLGARLTRTERSEPHSPTPPRLPGNAMLALAGVCWVGLVLTHQLSPIFVLAWVAAFALLTGRMPLWIPAVAAVVQVVWILQALPWLVDNVDFLSPDVASSARPKGAGDAGLRGQEVAKYAQLAVMGLLVAVAAAGAWFRIRAGRWEPALYALVLIPALVATVQRYGGEGPLRAYLFALPFLALLVVSACTRHGQLRRLRYGVVALLVAAAAPLAVFGLELAHRVPPEDLRIAAWVERNIPSDAARVYPSEASVRQLTADYARLADAPVLRLSLYERYLGRRWDRATVSLIESDLREFSVRQGYVILTPGQENYFELYGLVPSGSFEGLRDALTEAPGFTLAHRDGAARVFRWTP